MLCIMSRTDQLGGTLNEKLNSQLAFVRLAERPFMTPASVASPLPEVVAINPPKRRILLVDDNDDLLEVLSLVLEEKGFEVAAAANVNEALKLIAAQRFDVLLSDLQM